MDARIIPGQEPKIDDKETLNSLIDLLGNLDGGTDNEEFQGLKQEILDSGITTEGMLEILGNGFSEAIIQRPILDLGIQLLNKDATVPTYANTTDACADLYSAERVVIAPGETKLVGTGLAFVIPDGYVCHIYARSGLSVKTSLRLANSVGVIDAGYRDEVKVPCWNSGTEDIVIDKGMRIAQMDIMISPAMNFYEVENAKDYGEDRGGGFGHSGLFAETADDNG